jgi:hypothetical protein
MREVSPIVLGIGLFLICGFIAAVGSAHLRPMRHRPVPEALRNRAAGPIWGAGV